MTPRTKITAALAVVCVVILAAIWAPRLMSPSESHGAYPQPDPAPRTPHRLNSERAVENLASAAVSSVREAASRAGVASLPELTEAVQETILATAGADADRYFSLQERIGGTLTPRAERALERIASHPDLGMSEEEWSGLSYEAKVAHALSNPRLTGTDWASADAGNIEVLVSSSSPPLPRGWVARGRGSIFDPPDMRGLFSNMREDPKASVWVIVPVELNSDRRVFRIQFLHWPETETWHPIRFESIGPGDGPDILF